MKVLNWNVRRALSEEFDRVFRQLVAVERPYIVILLEPRLSGNRAVTTIRKSGFRFFIISEAHGFAGGLE